MKIIAIDLPPPSYQVEEKGKLLYRSPEADKDKNYQDCICFLADYNKKNPGNTARINLSPVKQLSLF